MLSSLGACSLIDDDLANCATTRTIDCRLHPTDNIDSLLAAQITGSGGQFLHDALTAYYEPLHHPASHTVRLDFYDVATAGLCTTFNGTLEDTTGTFRPELPTGHLRAEGLSPADFNPTAPAPRDTVVAPLQPVYTGSLDMPDNQPRYVIDLYPVNAHVAIAANISSAIRSVQIMAEDSAAHLFTERPRTSGLTQRIFVGTIIPEAAKEWRVVVLATTASGSITRTVLTINRPLTPGDIRVLQVSITDNGATQTTNAGVGASVTLDWKRGGTYNPEI